MRIITENYYDNGDFNRLYDNSWGGAIQTLDDIKNADKEEELMEHLEEVFGDREDTTDTDLNDYLWHDSDYIYEALGLDENGEIIEEEED